MKLNHENLKFFKADWPEKTYRARTDTHLYTVDFDGRLWRMRIWEKGTMVYMLYRTAPTARIAMLFADSHAGGNA